MKAERIYEDVCKMLKMYDAFSEQGASEDVIKNPFKYEQAVNYFPFYAIASKMLIDAKHEMDVQHQKNKGGNAQTVSAVKRIIKSVPEYRENMKGIFKQNNKYCICDGYRAVRLNDDITSVPHVDETARPIDLEQIFSGAHKEEAFDLPEVAEVKRSIAEQKANGAKKPNIWYNIVDDTWVNAEYLVDMLQILPNATAYKPINNRSMIYFESDDGDGVLLPVRRQV